VHGRKMRDRRRVQQRREAEGLLLDTLLVPGELTPGPRRARGPASPPLPTGGPGKRRDRCDSMYCASRACTGRLCGVRSLSTFVVEAAASVGFFLVAARDLRSWAVTAMVKTAGLVDAAGCEVIGNAGQSPGGRLLMRRLICNVARRARGRHRIADPDANQCRYPSGPDRGETKDHEEGAGRCLPRAAHDDRQRHDGGLHPNPDRRGLGRPYSAGTRPAAARLARPGRRGRNRPAAGKPEPEPTGVKTRPGTGGLVVQEEKSGCDTSGGPRTRRARGQYHDPHEGEAEPAPAPRTPCGGVDACDGCGCGTGRSGAEDAPMLPLMAGALRGGPCCPRPAGPAA